MQPKITYSDRIVYVDESGDHSLELVDPDYPVFVLSFCVFEKSKYTSDAITSLKKLKFSTFGHDMVVFHESEIRRKRGSFSCLSKESREAFLSRLTSIIDSTDFQLIAVVIDKRKLKAAYSKPTHPYHLALLYGLERIYSLLREANQHHGMTYIICEARGKKEDSELELEFRRIRDGANFYKTQLPFDIVIADKKTNSEGLQLADLTARPIGLYVLRPEQENRTYAILEKKFCCTRYGGKDGFGLKIFP